MRVARPGGGIALVAVQGEDGLPVSTQPAAEEALPPAPEGGGPAGPVDEAPPAAFGAVGSFVGEATEEPTTTESTLTTDALTQPLDPAAHEPAEPSPVPAPPASEAPARRRGGLLAAVAVVGCVLPVLAVAGGIVALATDAGGFATRLRELASGRGAEVAARAPAVPAAPVASEARAAAPAGPAIRFESAWPDTRRVTVRCDAEHAAGERAAAVAIERADRCAVTLIQRDRSRRIAIVDAPEAGVYRCFEDGQPECRRQ